MNANSTGRAGPKLVIFDCDGVLVDSEPISIAVLRDVIAEAGGPIDEATAYDRFLGRSMASTCEILRGDFGIDITDAHLEFMRDELNRRFEAELQPIPGIRQTLTTLACARCVASSSKPERIRTSLRVTGLLELLEPHIYSATMVERGKPAPDLFIHTAREMGVAPTDCLVIEDSPAGVTAARAAGMRVFGFTGGSHAVPGSLKAALAPLGAETIFDDMAQLPSLVAGTEPAAPAV
ncbi:HAD family hydrolase [Mesorhizobium xinjiangense]|uniref:HAD family hydrolase n=1 Tax=Mesorhizobium xinjiangense TaxID=2678685 RepID=UPI0012EDBEBA|nr:HAD family hydrolase [Mesorhizobium xinjiangense]